MNAKSQIKLIIETRQHIYWQVLEFSSLESRSEWYDENEAALPEVAYSINIHKKYPFLLLCIGTKSDVKLERVEKLGNRASDWYAEFHLRNKKLSKVASTDPEDIREYYKHWIWGDNPLSPDIVTLINLEEAVAFQFDYAQAYFSDFEDFESKLVNVQFLSGHRPDQDRIDHLIIDAWNFMAITEQMDEELN